MPRSQEQSRSKKGFTFINYIDNTNHYTIRRDQPFHQPIIVNRDIVDKKEKRSVALQQIRQRKYQLKNRETVLHHELQRTTDVLVRQKILLNLSQIESEKSALIEKRKRIDVTLSLATPSVRVEMKKIPTQCERGIMNSSLKTISSQPICQLPSVQTMLQSKEIATHDNFFTADRFATMADWQQSELLEPALSHKSQNPVLAMTPLVKPFQTKVERSLTFFNTVNRIDENNQHHRKNTLNG